MTSITSGLRSGRERGFTLMELMIGIVVLAVIAAVAFPSYKDSVRKSRRSEAFQWLSKIQLAQERWRGNNPEFSTDPNAELKVFPVNAPAATDHYTYSVSGPNLAAVPAPTLAEGYIAEAQGQNGQDADSQCSKMGVQMVGGNMYYAGCGGNGCQLVYAPANVCWNR